MPIDWFTVAAQAINFLILVWLLKRFLYKPILQAIDQREKGIATQLAQAEAKRAEAQKQRDDFQHKNEAFDQERASLLKKAEEDANAQRQRLLDDARKAADALRTKRQEALQSEQRNLGQEIIRRTQKEVFAVARRALTDLATISLEQRMTEVFIQRLRALNGDAKQQLAAALKASLQPARVCSAFDLPAAQRGEIENAIKETFATQAKIQFETVPQVVCGIELSVGGQKLAWSIAEYLSTLEKSAGELLLRKDAKAESQADAKPRPEAEAQSETDPQIQARPESKVDGKPAPKSQPQQLLKPVALAEKADH
jgi:F-type H+-transporting ATPase subunit b